ncbi:hypothetical protein Rsub_04429 [Raphidocelis subcapitata]|uniref:PROP1-like PPR domain-containing protein n=1 Tax=Raphidocelis subcapitata TaxID=307507 RepID=A0A2V0NZH8_9CHLO|nr:hypothetical protein Rsub_04429 [Raphidocelis subcapitata]|eukprot:GBF92082.1 hypothetical protein Rsub_04429 [Raphidocelis subcapitata]
MHNINQGATSKGGGSPRGAGAPLAHPSDPHAQQLLFLQAPSIAAAAAAPPQMAAAYALYPAYLPVQQPYAPPTGFAAAPAAGAGLQLQLLPGAAYAGAEAYGYAYAPLQLPQQMPQQPPPPTRQGQQQPQIVQQPQLGPQQPQQHQLEGSSAPSYAQPSPFSMFRAPLGGPATARAYAGGGGGSHGWRGARGGPAAAHAGPASAALAAAAGRRAAPYSGLNVEDVMAVLIRRPHGSSVVQTVGHLLPALDSRALAALLKEMHKRGMAPAATELFDWLRGLPPGHECGALADVYTYTTMIAQCTGPSQLRRALGLAADMRARGVPLNTHTFSALINVCIKAGEPQLALDSYAQMLSEGLVPNLVTYNTLLEAFAKQAMWEEAMSALESLQGQGLCPETRTYNVVMNACNAAGRHAHALAVFGAMTAAGRAPTTASFNAAIAAHCGLGNLDAAWASLQEMANRSCERTPATFTTLLRAAEAAGEWRFALDALDAMADSGLRLTPQAYACAIGACAAAGQLAAARDLTARLCGGGRGGAGAAPTHLLISMHDRCCDWRAAHAVFDDLEASGVRPDGASFGALTAALWGSGAAAGCLLALRVFEQACDLGVFKLSLRVDEGEACVVFTLPTFGAGMAIIGLWRLFQELALRLARDGAGILRRRVLLLVGQPSEAASAQVVEAMAAFCATRGTPFTLAEPADRAAAAGPGAAARLTAPSDAIIKWLASAVPAGAVAASAGAPGPGALMVPPALLRGLAHDAILANQADSSSSAAAIYARIRSSGGGSSRRASGDEGTAGGAAAAAAVAAALPLLGAASGFARGGAAASQAFTGSSSTSAFATGGLTSPGATPSVSRSLTPAGSLGSLLATATAAMAGSPPPPIALAMSPPLSAALLPPLALVAAQDSVPLPPGPAPSVAAAAAAAAAHFAGLSPMSLSLSALQLPPAGSGSFGARSAGTAGSTGSRSPSAAASATMGAVSAAMAVLCGSLLSGPGGELPEAAVLGHGAREVAAQAAAHPLSRGVPPHRVAELSLAAARRAAGLWPAWPRALVLVAGCADPEAAAARPDLAAFISALAAAAAAAAMGGPRVA